MQPFYLEYCTRGETLNLCISCSVAYADTGWSAVSKCLQHWLVGLAANQLLQVGALDPCVDPSPALTPAPRFQACKMEQGLCESSWCQCSMHTFLSFTTSIPALEAQGRDPAKCLTHVLQHSEVPLVSTAALRLFWTVALDPSLQNVLASSWRWG